MLLQTKPNPSQFFKHVTWSFNWIWSWKFLTENQHFGLFATFLGEFLNSFWDLVIVIILPGGPVWEGCAAVLKGVQWYLLRGFTVNVNVYQWLFTGTMKEWLLIPSALHKCGRTDMWTAHTRTFEDSVRMSLESLTRHCRGTVTSMTFDFSRFLLVSDTNFPYQAFRMISPGQ